MFRSFPEFQNGVDHIYTEEISDQEQDEYEVRGHAHARSKRIEHQKQGRGYNDGFDRLHTYITSSGTGLFYTAKTPGLSTGLLTWPCEVDRVSNGYARMSIWHQMMGSGVERVC